MRGPPLARVAVPLPSEPVGAGARWQVAGPRELDAVRAREVSTCTVKSLDEDSVTIDVQIELTAPPQSLTSAGGPAALTSLNGKGTMEGTIRLTRFAPAVELRTKTRSHLRRGNDEATATATLDLRTRPE